MHHHHAFCSAFVEKVLLLLLVLLQCGITSSFGKFDCFVTVRHRSGTPPDEMVKYVKENSKVYGDIVNGNPIQQCPPIYIPADWKKGIFIGYNEFNGCFYFRCLDSKGNDLFVISGCFSSDCDPKFREFCTEVGGKPKCKECSWQIERMGNSFPCNKELKELNKIPDNPNVEPQPVDETTNKEPTTTFDPPEIFVEFNGSVSESGTVTAASISAINTVVVPIIGAAIVRSMALS
ncbi:hypothetical protein niasHT_037282 [Heterodera trifolii]|uniref:Uncharacterized protein n=1 Tax=Heterodera trifolii TaxID=157864 RepID=A0ABD2J552_9BILA